MEMIRSGHFFYDLREVLGDIKFLGAAAIIGGLLILLVSTQFIYLLLLFFLGTIIGRALIGRRCPRCDRPLKQAGAEPKKNDAFTLVITWACPHDNYTEKEETKSKIGFFGSS
jgi:hypothetical protein